jgi:ABC-2 type transport system permease protein
MNVVRAEWTKLRTTPGLWWLLLVTAAVTVGLSAAVTAAAACPPMDCARLALSGVYLGQAPVAVLAVLTVSGEYSTALIRTTLTAVPNRAAVLAAKAVVLAAAVAAAGAPTLLASLLVAGIGLPHGPMLRATGGSVAYLALIALLSLGIAAVVRDSAAAIGTVLGLLYLPPVLTQMVTDPRLHRLLERIAPMSAGLSIQATRDLGGLAIGPWPGLGVLAAWSAGALLAGTVLLHCRDT